MSLPARKNIRLKDYDYNQNGAYFVTICTADRKCTLANITRRGDPCGRLDIELTHLGLICDSTFAIISGLFNVIIDKYVIMPNHVHVIMIMTDEQATARVAPTVSLGSVVGAYKSIVSNTWLKLCKEKGTAMGRVWQRNYYEHIIRDENDYLTKWNYIDENSVRWAEDEYFG